MSLRWYAPALFPQLCCDVLIPERCCKNKSLRLDAQSFRNVALFAYYSADRPLKMQKASG
jgi:hypothetical protein